MTGSSLVSNRLLFCAPESLVYKSRPKYKVEERRASLSKPSPYHAVTSAVFTV